MFPTSRTPRIAAGTLVALALAASLGACAEVARIDRPQATARPLSGVVATGTLVGGQPDVPVGGRVIVVADRSTRVLTVKLVGLSGGFAAATELTFAASRVAPGTTCTPHGLAYANGGLADKSDQSFTFPPDGSPGWQNPSFLHSVMLTSAKPSADGCVSPLVAYAPLKWSVGDVRPDINVFDGGSRRGAEGVAVAAKGSPSSYTVAAGDNLDSIATRFHLTLDDLFYLNPARTPSPLSPTTQPGDVLNLSKANR